MIKNAGDTRSLVSLILIIVCTAFLSAFVTRSLMPSISDDAMEKSLTEFVLKNPTIIANAVKQAYEIEQQRANADAKKNVSAKRDELENDKGSPMVGNPDSDSVVVEFFDYNCGYCKKMLPDVNALLKENKDVRLVLKEIPILGEMSRVASQFSIAIHKSHPDKYWAFHNSLLKSGARSKEKILQTAAKLGLDVAELEKIANSKEVSDQLDKHIALARDIGVRGTPAFVIGDTIIRGAQGKKALTDALAKNN